MDDFDFIAELMKRQQNSKSSTKNENSKHFVDKTADIFAEVTSKCSIGALLNIELTANDKDMLAFHESQNVASSALHDTNQLIDLLAETNRQSSCGSSSSSTSSSSSSRSNSRSGNSNYQLDHTGNVYCQEIHSAKVVVNSVFHIDSDTSVAKATNKIYSSTTSKLASNDDVIRSKTAQGMKDFAMKQSAIDLAVSKLYHNCFTLIK